MAVADENTEGPKYGRRVGASPSDLLGGGDKVVVPAAAKPAAAAAEPAPVEPTPSEVVAGAKPAAVEPAPVEPTPAEVAASAAAAEPAPVEPTPAEVAAAAAAEPAAPEVSDLVVDALVERNFLPESFDKSLLKDEEDFVQAVVKHSIDPIRDQERQALEAQYIEQGIDPKHLESVRLRTMGLSAEDVQKAQDFKALHEWQPTEAQQEHFNLNYNYYYYRSKNLGEAESNRLAQNDAASENAAALIDERRAYFGEMSTQASTENEAKMAAHSATEAQKVADNTKKVETILKSGTIGGEKYSPEQIKKIRQAVMNPTEVIEVDGKPVRLSKYRKTLHELMSTAEGELELAARILFTTPKEVKEERNQREVSNGLLNDLNRITPQRAKPSTKAAEARPPGSRSYGTRV